MKIVIEWGVDKNKSTITGIAGVTDVVAATYNIIYLLKHSKEFYIVRDNNAAIDALAKFPEALLVGESTDPGLPFVCPNSPVAIAKLNLAEKTVILKTNNGTSAVGEVLTLGASTVFAYHWANIQSVAMWLKKQKTSKITLIACGGREQVFNNVHGHLLEDWYCTQALQELLEGKKVNYEKYFEQTKKSLNDQYPPGDPSDATREIVLQQENDMSGIIPVFSETEDGIYKVSNALR